MSAHSQHNAAHKLAGPKHQNKQPAGEALHHSSTYVRPNNQLIDLQGEEDKQILRGDADGCEKTGEAMRPGNF